VQRRISVARFGILSNLTSWVLALVRGLIPRGRRGDCFSGLLSGCLIAVLLAGSAGAALSQNTGRAATSAGKISAHLTKRSFTSSQATQVKLIYQFSPASKSFGYLLSFKSGSTWQTLSSFKRRGSYRGVHSMSLSRLFAGKPVRAGRYRLKLTADANSKLLTFAVVAAAPTNTALPTILPTVSGTATEGQKLTATRGSWANSPISYRYQWRRCNAAGTGCTDIPGATGISYRLVYADASHTMRIVVTASNALGSARANSSETEVVFGLPPASTALPSITGTATQGRKLTASHGSWSNSPTGYAYQWRRCDGSGASCTDIPGATASSYTLVEADAAHTIRVVVAAVNAWDYSVAASKRYPASSTVLGLPPVNTALPAVSGTAIQGQVLTALTGSWANTPSSYKYKWRRCDAAGNNCADISGATASSYTLVYADAAHTIRAVVTASNAYGPTAATSSRYPMPGTVTGLLPVNTALPTISGTAKQGQVLTASNGSWTNSPTSYLYQWRRCDSSGASCTDIVGATARTYTPVYADATHTVRVFVTAKNPYGINSASSNRYPASGTVTGLPPVNTVLPAVSGTATQGQALTASNGSWDNSPTSYRYQWRRCNSSGASCTDIPGATASSYTLVYADAAHSIRAVVTAANAYGPTAATSNRYPASATVTGLAPVDVDLPTVSGTATQGQALTAANGSWNNSPTSYTYQWRSCDASGASCTDIPGATAGSYTLVYGDATHTIRVVVKATNPYGFASATSSQYPATGLVTGLSPVNTALPAISGMTLEGHVLTTSDGHWDNSPTSYTYQWRRCDTAGNNCADISDATASSYTLSYADAAHTIRVVVTAANAYGTTAATSTQTGTATAIYTTVTTISSGYHHTCALLNSGKVKCWGLNHDGQLGNGSTTTSSTPVPVSGITNAIAISAGDYQTCALLADGTVKCWGRNNVGQLGDGTTTDSSTPVPVSGITNAVAISAGYSYNCALLADKTVECWGYNVYGELGDGTTTNRSAPVPVGGIANVSAVSAGSRHACALLPGGVVKCWGDNESGQLGDGTTSDSSTPVAVSGITNASAISAHGMHTCALLSGGTLACWGLNNDAQLGDGKATADALTDSPTPVLVRGIGNVGSLTSVTAVAAGDFHTCALLSGGTSGGPITCWGDNGYGELGDGIGQPGDLYANHGYSITDSDLNDFSPTPVHVGGITNAVVVSLGASHTCALLAGGTVKCWGRNDDGQLGDGTTTDRSNPVRVIRLTDASAISAGASHSCIALSDGQVECWGSNHYGQLGDGTTTDSSTPVPVGGITNASSVSAGADHSCALLSDGTVKCWGRNNAGQLGNGTTTDSSTPVSVSTITTAIAISAGDYQTCALLSAGTVECWGLNHDGQLGNGATTDSSIPVSVSTITTATAVSAGDFHSCALLTGGTVDCWGSNNYGQLGNGTTTGSSTPVPVSTIATATSVDAGVGHTCARLTGGSVDCWGRNDLGQLGNGTTTGSPTPVPVSGITTASAVSAGNGPTCALLSTGAIECWGFNLYGALGNGTTTDSSTAVLVKAVTKPPWVFSAVSAGGNQTCAILSDGAVACWGQDDVGQLGDYSNTNSSTSVGVDGLTPYLTPIP
jgi:alpha-tubulin suppressor-like RCC1 family protein